MNIDENRSGDGNICPSMSIRGLIENSRFEIDNRTEKNKGRVLKRYFMSRNRRNSNIDLHVLMACWRTHEWSVK